MCGIAGIVAAPGAPPPQPAQLAALAKALAHRGPDGSGHHVVGRVALVHNRLAIIDVAGGDQPLFAASATLVGNGEIYNYRELYDELPGVRFATRSDNEPPLHLWLRDGADMRRTLRGMYAIAIHERADRTVTLSRDPFGIKPLYVCTTEAGLAFASEPQALLAAGLMPRKLRAAARDELLQVQFTSGAETIFEGIHRVLPGETLTCAEGRVLERSRLSALPEGGPEDIDEDAALARLDQALTESVELHQRSDVPYGMFLSGGIDSVAILTLMARLNAPRRCWPTPPASTAPPWPPTSAMPPGRTSRARHAGAQPRDASRSPSGNGVGAPARDRRRAWTIRRPTTPSSPPGSWPGTRRPGCQGDPVRRGRRRDVRRLRPLPRRHAAEAGWPERVMRRRRQFRPASGVLRHPIRPPGATACGRRGQRP